MSTLMSLRASTECCHTCWAKISQRDESSTKTCYRVGLHLPCPLIAKKLTELIIISGTALTKWIVFIFSVTFTENLV